MSVFAFTVYLTSTVMEPSDGAGLSFVMVLYKTFSTLGYIES